MYPIRSRLPLKYCNADQLQTTLDWWVENWKRDELSHHSPVFIFKIVTDLYYTFHWYSFHKNLPKGVELLPPNIGVVTAVDAWAPELAGAADAVEAGSLNWKPADAAPAEAPAAAPPNPPNMEGCPPVAAAAPNVGWAGAENCVVGAVPDGVAAAAGAELNGEEVADAWPKLGGGFAASCGWICTAVPMELTQWNTTCNIILHQYKDIHIFWYISSVWRQKGIMSMYNDWS